MKALILLAAALMSGSQAWANPEPVTAQGTRNLKPRLIVGFKQGVSIEERNKTLESLGMQVADDLDPFNAVVAETPAEKFQPSAVRLLSMPSVLFVEEDVYRIWINVDAPMGFQQVPLPSLRSIMAELPKVAPPVLLNGEFPWGIDKVGAQDAWSKTQGDGVKVAVIDTGIDRTHPDIAPNYAGGYNAMDKKKAPHDDNGHGTHVAGTIAAVKDGKGVVGVAPKAKLYAVKVLDADGGGTLTSIVKGLIWVARNDIKVANMSLGAPVGSIFMHWAIMYAHAKGVALVVAAGNSGGSVSYPGAYAESIAVSALDPHPSANGGGTIADFSSRGKEVDFIAPGVDVWSDAPCESGQCGLAMHSGTSMATPHVAGLAALAVSKGAKGPEAVRAALKAASGSVGLSAEEQGWGLPNAGKIAK